MTKIKNVVVFSGSSEGNGVYAKLAGELGKILAQNDYAVANGGGPGLMELVAKSAFENNGKVIGIHYATEGRKQSKYNTETVSYEELGPRQQKLMSLGDAFVVLPGGLGTLYELVEIIVKKYIGEIHKNVPIIVVSSEYWKPFNELINKQIQKQFMTNKVPDSFKVVDTPEEVLSVLQNAEAEKQMTDQEERWNSRAGQWDKDISSPEHYANFEDGYQKFFDLEKKVLDKVGDIESAIDLGCGSGQTTVLLTSNVTKIYALDLAQEMLNETLKKVPQATGLHASITEVPLPDKSVDLAISRGIVLSHLPANLTDKFFQEIGRIVKSGGIVLFDYLSNPDTASYKNASPKIAFTKQQITEKLSEVGFENMVFDGEESNRVVRVVATKK